MSKIAIDCDGVLADFNEAFMSVANRLYPGRFPPNYQPKDWNYEGKITPKEQEKIWRVIQGTQNFWLGLFPYESQVGDLAHWLVKTKNHEVYIVTSRQPTSGMCVAKQTEMWVDSCGIRSIHNHLGIIVVPDSNEKWKLYQSGGFEWSIDDKPETVEQCDMIHPQLYNHRAFLMERPWNGNAKVQRRVKSVGEFLRRIDDGKL